MTQKKSESQAKPEVKEKSTSKDKPEVKEKSTSKDKPESKGKSDSKGKLASKEKSPSKEKSESKTKTANKAKLTSKIKLDKPELNKFTVGGLVVLMLVALVSLHTCSGEKAPVAEDSSTLPSFTQNLEAQEPPREEPKLSVAVVGDDGKPDEIVAPENDISGTDIPSMTNLGIAAVDALFPPESMSNEIYEESNAVLATEGILTTYRTVGDNSRNIFMDKNFYKTWRDDRSKSTPTAATFFLDPTFIIMKDDLNDLSADVADYNGVFEVQVPISLTHKVFQDAALKSIKATLKSFDVPNFDAVTMDNLQVVKVLRCWLEVPGYGWHEAPAPHEDGKFYFTKEFKERDDFNKFKKALSSGKCRVKYVLSGQRVTPSSLKVFVSEIVKEINDANAKSDVQDEGFKAGAKTLNVKHTQHSAGSKPTFLSILFDMDKPASSDSVVKSEGEQSVKHKVEINRDDLYKHVTNIVKNAGASIDVLKGTDSEKLNEMLAIAKLVMEQGNIDKECELVRGKITSFDVNNNSFQLALNDALKTDLTPSEITSLKDALSSKFSEKYNSVEIDEEHDKESGEREESRDATEVTGDAAYAALAAGKIKFPIDFSFYRVSQFLMNFDSNYLVNIGEWETGAYPVKDGFVAVCEELPGRDAVFKCTLNSQDATILPRNWEKEGSGCLAHGFSIFVDASLSKIESGSKNSTIEVNSFDFMFDMNVKIDGNDEKDNNTLYQQSRTSKKTVKRGDAVTVGGESISEGNSERGAVFQFLGFCDERGKRKLGNKIEISIEQNEPKCNHGMCGPDHPNDYPHDSPLINLLQQHSDARNLFKKLTVTGEFHDYYQWYEEYDFFEKAWTLFSDGGEWHREYKCKTVQEVKVDCQPVFYYKAKIQLPTVVMESNRGTGITIDYNDASSDETGNQSQTQ